MEEINLTEELTVQVSDIEVENLADETEEIAIQAPIAEVSAEDAQVINLTVQEAIGASNVKVVADHGYDLPNQHTIEAITGLTEKLESIEALKAVYSNGLYQANYFMWHDENPLQENREGFFVILEPKTSTIKICGNTDDVFGVTVGTAGFVGGQDDNARDCRYGLVVHSGIATVQCESDVVVGDYVVPNIRGIAEKSNGSYGYLVNATETLGDISYATIVLTQSSVNQRVLSDEVQNIGSRMTNAEYNIVAATNVANAAYKLAIDTNDTVISDIGRIEEETKDALDKVDKMESDVGDLSNQVQAAGQSAIQARAVADAAVSSANTIRSEAVATANEAIAAIKDIGAGSTSWAKRLDSYSVGEYSQAYGLTWEQAKSAMVVGMVHIPTIAHIETYVGVNDTYEQKFLIGYYYEWNGEKWAPSPSVAVHFSSVYINGSEQAPYWVVTNSDVEYNGIIYKLGYLYKWETSAWNTTGASVTENTLTRAVSAMHQTANELSMDVTNVKGDVASLKVTVDENSADIQSVTQWTKGKSEYGEDLYNVATIKQQTDDGGSSIALVVADVEGNKILKGASIVLGQSNDEDSYIAIDADRIVMTGTTTFLTPNDLGENGTTVIAGGRISTGSITAKQIATDAIRSRNQKPDIQGVINYIPESTDGLSYGFHFSTADKSWYCSTTQGLYTDWEPSRGSYLNLEDGSFLSKNFVVTPEGYLYATGAHISGDITAISGTFDNCTINESCTILGSVEVAKSIAVGDLFSADATAGTVSIGGFKVGTQTESDGKLNGSSYTNIPAIFCESSDVGAMIQLKNPTSGTYCGMKSTDNTFLYAGAKNSGNADGGAKFRVTHTGLLTATGANITGTINADYGYIGNWKLNNSNLRSYANSTDYVEFNPTQLLVNYKTIINYKGNVTWYKIIETTKNVDELIKQVEELERKVTELTI